MKYIMDNKTCSYHARGELCPMMANKTYCSYSHAQKPIPWKSYPRKTGFSKEVEMAAIQLEQLGYNRTFPTRELCPT